MATKYIKKIKLGYTIHVVGISGGPIPIKNTQTIDGEVSNLVRKGFELKDITIHPVWV